MQALGFLGFKVNYGKHKHECLTVKFARRRTIRMHRWFTTKLRPLLDSLGRSVYITSTSHALFQASPMSK